MNPRRVAWYAAIVASTFVAACGESSVTGPDGRTDDPPDENTAPAAPSYAQDVNPIFAAAGCSAGSCHGNGAGGLTLTTSAAANYDALVGVTSGCNGLLLVAPNDPTNSFLLMKVEGRQSCGARMPIGGTMTATQIGTIRNWIATGAPQN